MWNFLKKKILKYFGKNEQGEGETEAEIVAPNLFFALWTLFSFVLSLFSLVIAVLIFFVDRNESIGKLVYLIDIGICFVFFSEFIILLLASKNKALFLKWHWVDLLAVIPFNEFRVFRLFRLFLIIRVVRYFLRFGKIKNLLPKKQSDVIITRYVVFFFLLIVLLLIPAASLLILVFESGTQGANIKTPIDAMWWSIVTITTVGYGEFYPVSSYGRGIAIFLMVIGIGIFSSITVYLSSFITQILRSPGINPETDVSATEKMNVLLGELRALHREIRAIKKRLPFVTPAPAPALELDTGQPRKKARSKTASASSARRKAPMPR